MDDLNELHRLAPAVDTDTARAAFWRRRRRSRSLRRGGLAAAAVVVLAAGSVFAVANLDGDSPLVTGPAQDAGSGQITFEVLTVAQASDELGTLRAATNEGDYINLWKFSNTSDPRPEVAFTEQVVVSFTVPFVCPPTLSSLEHEGPAITPEFEERLIDCDAPTTPTPWTYVVALGRAALEPAFTLRLPADPTNHFGEQRLEVDLGGTSATGDAPRVWVQAPSSSDEGMAAEVKGTLLHDEDYDCFRIELEGFSYPVVWPTGTVGTADGPGVVLPQGQVARVGDEVYGGGGYLDVADEYGIPAECLPDSGEVAVYNPNEEVTVNPSPTAEVPEPTCAEVEAFDGRLREVPANYDVFSSPDPEAMFDQVDVVLIGQLTGGHSERQLPDEWSEVGIDIEVSAALKSPDAATGRQRIWIPVATLDPAVVPPVGAPVVVFANESSDGLRVSEGFVTACSEGPPVGRQASRWTDVGSLDDLTARLEAAANG